MDGERSQRWRLSTLLQDVVIMRGWDARPEERERALGSLSALALIDAWLRDPATRGQVLRVSHEALDPLRIDDAARASRRLRDAFGSGWLVALAFDRPRLEEPPEPVPEPGAARPPPVSEVALTWIEIELVDTHEQPVGGQRYRVEPADGMIREGRLDASGFARVDGIVPGSCEVTFPDLDKADWDRA